MQDLTDSTHAAPANAHQMDVLAGMHFKLHFFRSLSISAHKTAAASGRAKAAIFPFISVKILGVSTKDCIILESRSGDNWVLGRILAAPAAKNSFAFIA